MIRSVTKYIGSGIITQTTLFAFWILAGKYLNVELVGSAYQYLFLLDVTVIFSMFGAESVINKYYFSELSKERVFDASLKIAFIGYVFTFIIFISLFIFKFLKFDLLLLVLFLIHVFFNILTNLIYSDLIANKDSNGYLLANIKKSLSFLVISVGLFFFKNIYFFSITYLFSFIIILYSSRKKLLNSKLHKKLQLNSYLIYSLPFMLYSLTGIIHSYSSRYLVSGLLDIQNLAIFGLFYTFYSLAESFISNLNKTWTPFIYSKLQNEEDVVNNVIFYINVLVISTYSIFFFGFTLLENTFFHSFLFSSVYNSKIIVLYIILLSPFFLLFYSILSPIITFNKDSKKYFISNLIKTILSIIASFYLINSYKLIGAACAVFIASFLNLFVFIIFYFKSFKIKKLYFTYFLYTLAVLLINLFLLLNFKYLPLVWKLSILLHVLPFLLLLFNYKKIKLLPV